MTRSLEPAPDPDPPPLLPDRLPDHTTSRLTVLTQDEPPSNVKLTAEPAPATSLDE